MSDTARSRQTRAAPRRRTGSRLVQVMINDSEHWNAILRSLPYHHILQSWQWGELKRGYGWTVERMAFKWGERGPVVAAAQVLARRARPLPLAVLYVPKGPAMDYADPGLRAAVLDALVIYARRRRAIFVKIDPDVVLATGVPGGPDDAADRLGMAFVTELQSGGWHSSDDQIQFRNTVQLDLTCTEQEMLGAMKQKTRYNIRLASRKGVAVRSGLVSDLELLFAMYAETAARDAFVIRPAGYYLDAWRTCLNAGLAHVLIAEHEGLAIAAVILFCFGDRVWYMYGASCSAHRERMPNHLLQWEAIRWARQQGFRVYDMWGAPNDFVQDDPLWGVWGFKAGFGGRVVRHIGAWDKTIARFWHWFYMVAIPFYLALRRSMVHRRQAGPPVEG